MPHNPEEVLGINRLDGWTFAEKYKTYHEATGRIRKSLGVKFSDFYNFSEHNILVEGQTDRKYFEFVLDYLRKDPVLSKDFEVLLLPSVSVHDYGGVRGIEGFLRATFEFIRKERATITILDGDHAGDKARQDLQGYFGKKNIPFQAGTDFIVTRDRFAVEGLLPDPWIKDLYASHPGWFENYAEDAVGVILPFKVKDSSKDHYLHWFTSKANSAPSNEWFGRWKPILAACEASLKKQAKDIYKT